MSTKKKTAKVKKPEVMTQQKAKEEFEKFREVELAKLRDYHKEMTRPDFIVQVIRQTYMKFYDEAPAWEMLSKYVDTLEAMIADMKSILEGIDYDKFVSVDVYEDPYKKYIIRKDDISGDRQLFKAFVQYQVMAPFGEQLMRAWMAAKDAQKEIETKNKADEMFKEN